MAKKILYIIDSLSRGGAELLLVEFIASLPMEYEVTVVILHEPDTLRIKLPEATTLLKLDFKNKYSIAGCAIKLNIIIKQYNITLVHAHLYLSTLVARLATPTGIPLVFSVHNALSEEVFAGSCIGKWLERLTYNPDQQAIFVSNASYSDYARHVALGPKATIIYNFVTDAFFDAGLTHRVSSGKSLSLVAVGNLKKQKNFETLIAGMDLLKDEPGVSLAIYGEGPERSALQKLIAHYGLDRVILCGSHDNLAEVLPRYDAFVLSTRYEGFCVAMAEAMATGLACLVSDIAVLKEVSEGKQLYFNPTNPEEFAAQVKGILQQPEKLQVLGQLAKQTAQKYKRVSYTLAVTKIYTSLLQHRNGR